MIFKKVNENIHGFSELQQKTSLRIAICDDELYMAEDLREKTNAYFAAKKIPVQIESFASGASLLRSGRIFDIVLLDIRMRDLDGMQTAKALRQQEYRGFLIFVTALEEYVFDSFAVEAYDFLVKPIDEARFACTLDRALETMKKQRNEMLLIQKSGDYLAVPLAEVLYCEVINRKVYVNCHGREPIDYYDKIETLENKLGENFFRCHRSYLVNMKSVRGYESGQAVLMNGVKIPVSRLRGREFAQALLAFMKR